VREDFTHETDQGAAMRQNPDRSRSRFVFFVEQQFTAVFRFPFPVEVQDDRQPAPATLPELVDMPAVKCPRTVERKVGFEVEQAEKQLLVDCTAELLEPLSAEFPVTGIEWINPADQVGTNPAIDCLIASPADARRAI
jgi:hypothetical protein